MSVNVTEILEVSIRASKVIFKLLSFQGIYRMIK